MQDDIKKGFEIRKGKFRECLVGVDVKKYICGENIWQGDSKNQIKQSFCYAQKPILLGIEL